MIQTKSEQLLGTDDINGDSNDNDVDDGGWSKPSLDSCRMWLFAVWWLVSQTKSDDDDDNVDDGGVVQYRVGVVTDVDLGIVSKTLVARGLVSYPSGTLRWRTLDLLDLDLDSKLLEKMTIRKQFAQHTL